MTQDTSYAGSRAIVRKSRVKNILAPLPWLLPAVGLIVFVVLWPVVSMFQTSREKISGFGFDLGSAGWDNYSTLFKDPNLGPVMIRTVIWVVVVVGATMLISLGIAQLLNQRFPGRKVVRWALIAPWAASVMMTSLIFRWALDPNNGVVNVFLHQLGIVKSYNSNQAAWLGSPDAALGWMMFVAVFVSVPFATYAILAGLTSIPSDVYEAARVDGASKLRAYWSITLPLLRPAMIVAALINIMNVFNSFPIIYVMTGGGPNAETSTSAVYMYSLKEFNIGQSGALAVVNFGIVIVIVLFFLRVNRSSLKAN